MTVKKKVMVKMDKKTHFDVKLFACKQSRTMIDVVDVACKEYLAKHDKKEADTKEKE